MWKQRPYDIEKEKIFLSQGKGKLLSRILSQRNIDPESVQQFIESDYKKISHPFSKHIRTYVYNGTRLKSKKTAFQNHLKTIFSI